MIDRLKWHFSSTNIQELKQEWEEIEQMGFSGANAFEFIDLWEDHYKILLPEFCHSKKQIEIPENMTPNFSGSFFLIKIAE